MFCQLCGENLQPDAKFCTKCGAPISKSDIKPTEYSSTQNVATNHIEEQGKTDKKKVNYLLRHWRGELSLPISYWLNGFLGNIVAILLIFGIAGILGYINNAYTTLVYWVSAISFVLIVTCWQAVGIWRSSDRYEREKGRHFWAVIAKLMVILGLFSITGEFGNTYIPAIKESLDRAAWHSELSWDIRLLNEGKEIELFGGVKKGITDDLSTILSAANNVEIIHVNLDQGGYVDEAILLQQVISENNLSTYVSGDCVSACTIVFLGGKKRYIKSSAKLGFHAYSIPGIKDSEMDYSENKKHLRNLGVDENFITRIFDTPSDEMWYPSADELINANVVHDVISGNEFAISGIASHALTMELDDLETTLDNIKNATTTEESLRYAEEYRKKVKGDTSLLKSRAKSPASIEFVRLTDKQNNLSTEAKIIEKKLDAIYRELENMDFETNDENEFQIITDTYVNYCKLSKEYNSLLSEIVAILNKKVNLLNDPAVTKELTGNTQGIEELIIRVRDTQVYILADQEQVYKDNSCDEILSAKLN